MTPLPRRAAVIGAGPAGLMAAEVLARNGVAVMVYDRMPSAGRKFLLAGRGGLNLTHSDAFDRFVTRYGAAAPRLRPVLAAFPAEAVRAWAADLGQPTFVGTSGRIFPESFKASPLLRAWLRRLDGAGVRFRPRHTWLGWTADGRPLVAGPNGAEPLEAEVAILALGGASWPHLGSDGRWTATLSEDGAAVMPLRPSNCGMRVAWTDLFRNRFEGHPLKGIGLRFKDTAVRGEMMITRAGLEGGAIYALSAVLRDALEAHGTAMLNVALRPDLDPAGLEGRLSGPVPKRSLSTHLMKRLKLSPAAVGLLQEAAILERTPLAGLSPAALARRINAVPVRLEGVMPIARAISTAGGLAFSEVDERLMLRRHPGTFAAGEMLDWEAPTGGYLLQACLATGVAAATGALHWLDSHPLRAVAPVDPSAGPEPGQHENPDRGG